jgi:phosphatidylglycerophosphatase A
MTDESFATATTIAAPRRPTVRLLLSHPAHAIALGFGSGLAPVAPGTVGTLWAWLAYLVIQPMLSTSAMGVLLLASFFVGWWACTVCARAMAVADRCLYVCGSLAFAGGRGRR